MKPQQVLRIGIPLGELELLHHPGAHNTPSYQATVEHQGELHLHAFGNTAEVDAGYLIVGSTHIRVPTTAASHIQRFLQRQEAA